MQQSQELDHLRERIDSLDDRILELLEERARVVEEVGGLKRREGRAFHDPEREKRVLDRLCARASGRFPHTAIRAVFREIMSACLSLEQPITVAYVGPESTPSHQAALAIFGLAARYRETATIEGVFEAVARREAYSGIVPIENSSAGAVGGTLDALVEGDLRIRQEFVLDVDLSLLSRATRLSDIERVYSPAVAVAQVRLWLAKNLASAQIVHTTSTTEAVREALADTRAAAIATAFASELYGLPVLRERVQDRAWNATRFVVIASEDGPPTGNDKTTLAFSLPDAAERGSLRRALEVFDDAGINLTRVESRPKNGKSWSYLFFVDIEGHHTEPTVARALAELQTRSETMKILGSYPRADEASTNG